MVGAGIGGCVRDCCIFEGNSHRHKGWEGMTGAVVLGFASRSERMRWLVEKLFDSGRYC